MVVQRSVNVPLSWLQTMPRRRLRVGVNLLWLVPGRVGGSEDYAIGLVRALRQTDELDLVVFCQPPLVDVYPELGDAGVIVPGPAGGQFRGLRLLWENTWLTTRSTATTSTWCTTRAAPSRRCARDDPS
jgi:hypothetical protein